MIIQERVDLKRFLSTMSHAVLEAGELARAMQGKVKNLAKKIAAEEGLSEVEKYIRSAQTEIDIKSQEILIKAALEVLDKDTQLDAEEKSPSVHSFKGQNKNLTLVLDPIDGTFEYLSNKDEYSICVGLVFEGKVVSALVYYPNLDTLYYINEEGNGRVDKNHSLSHFNNSTPLEILDIKKPNLVYVGNFSNTIDSQMAKEKLERAGFEVITSTELGIGDSEILLKIIHGEGLAFLIFSSQVRDELIGAVLQAAENGYAINLTGRQLIWPQGGKIKEVIFGGGEIPNKLIAALTNDF